MADTSSQLTPEPRALLAFGAADVGNIPTNPDHRSAMPPRPRRPGGERQGERLAPQFQALQDALKAETTALSESTSAPDPEFIVVFEVAGTIDRFMRAAQGIEGLDFITDFVGDGIEPDDDFYYIDDEGEPSDEPVRQTLYLVMANERAIQQLVSLFELIKNDPKVKLERGLGPLKALFNELHTIRRWGPQDRIAESGLLEHLREDLAVKGGSGSVRVEVELVWRPTVEARMEAQRQVEAALAGGVVVSTSVVEAISYHALLVDLPANQVDDLVNDGPEAIDLLLVDDVLFVSAAEPMTLSVEHGAPTPELPERPRPALELPKVALLDGLPLANHALLDGRLTIDDPHDRRVAYTPQDCSHGTAMASLIIHGDLAGPADALGTRLYVQPILIPHEFQAGFENPPRDLLLVDIVHAAFERMFGGSQPAAPSVRIVNLSIGEPGRAFTRRLSPLARLLDYLSHRYNLVVVVSAGNHPNPRVVVPAGTLTDPDALGAAVRQSLHDRARLLRLLAPAESINALTVGAVHADNVIAELPDTVVDPLPPGSVAMYSPSGSGFRRSPKPELHHVGGRSVVLRPPAGATGSTELLPAPSAARGPGLLAAAPTRPAGTTGTLHSSGTSNAAALVTRSALQVLEHLEQLQSSDGDPEYPDPQYHPVLVKTLLVHATNWPQEAWQWADELGADGNSRRPTLTRKLGFGRLNVDSLASASPNRVSLIGAGSIGNKKRHSFRFPLPGSLSALAEWRRLTVTLAWLSPTVPTTQQYRVADLKFGSPRADLAVRPTEVDWVANGKGTVLHEVLEGKQATAFTDGSSIVIDVDCRVRVGRLNEPVRFGLAATLEVAPALRVDLHQEVRTRLREEVRARIRARAGA